MRNPWKIRKNGRQWQVYRLGAAHAEVIPGAWRTERDAQAETTRLNLGGRTGPIKIIPA